MANRSTTALRVFAVGTLLAGGVVWAHSAGPTVPSTGAPPFEGTCADPACHDSFAEDSGPGGFAISHVTSTPGEYTPGDTVDFQIHLQQTGQRRWGFQVTAINSSGDPVGTILVSEPTRTHLESGPGGRQYLTHTTLGTDSNTVDASPGWTFKWRAPGSGAGTVTFYAAGNAANADGTSLGDYIYTLSQVLSEGPVAVREDGAVRPGSFQLGANFPNPFNAGTRIPYKLSAEAAGPVSLTINDVRGRRVQTLLSTRYTGAGDHWIDWNGEDLLGVAAASGVYFVRLSTRAGSDTRKLLLLR